jgi:hypothetical protein
MSCWFLRDGEGGRDPGPLAAVKGRRKPAARRKEKGRVGDWGGCEACRTWARGGLDRVRWDHWVERREGRRVSGRQRVTADYFRAELGVGPMARPSRQVDSEGDRARGGLGVGEGKTGWVVAVGRGFVGWKVCGGRGRRRDEMGFW